MTAADHSFVVLAYGDSPFLAGCLQSLNAQTARSRVLVSTSTPSAHIETACRKAGAELRINPERGSIGGDWNFGLRCASSRFVTPAHQDDLYRPTFLERTLARFAERPDAALCFTGYDEIDDAGEARISKISRVKHLIERLTLGGDEAPSIRRLRMFLAFGNPLPCSSVTLNRERLPDFTFSTTHASNLDWDAWWRLLDEGQTFVRTRERLVGRRHNALTETSRLIGDGRRRREDAAMFARIWPRPFGGLLAAAYRASY